MLRKRELAVLFRSCVLVGVFAYTSSNAMG